ncbi:MAG TPA: DUF1844 domain-containing protein [Candidatus Binataceae bacterium]|nr:DUF1844 domain-containing protein [Candidatus Binataceae bacterium]
MRDEEEKDKGFKVQDRRRFSAEGELKPGDTDEPVTAAAEPAPSPKPSGGAHHAEPEINFVTFVVGLSTEALAALGEMPDPATGKPSRDLRAAQQMIDIIAMLAEKTRGNLDPNEQSLVEAILFDLRMKYVELAKPPAH